MTAQEWGKAIEGKPVNEWPPLPGDITCVIYPKSGIIIANREVLAQFFNEGIEESARYCKKYLETKECPIIKYCTIGG